MKDYRVQSIVFNKHNYSLIDCEKWLKKHKFKIKKIDDTKDTYRFRQFSPQYIKRLGYTHYVTKKIYKGISLVIAYHETYKGGEISTDDLQHLLKASYAKDKGDVGDYVLDKELSNAQSQVYHNSVNNKSVISHTGSQNSSDWFSNLKYALGIDPEFEHRRQIQQKAHEKYGDKLITVGHSRGALAAEKLAHKNGEVYTLNKPTNIKDIYRTVNNPNQVDVRHKNDIVSFLTPFQKRNGKLLTIDNGVNDYLKAHSTSNLKDLKHRILGN